MFYRPKYLAAAPIPVATLTVKTRIDGVPAKKRISIFDRQSQALLWHSFTNSNGEITIGLPLNYVEADYLSVVAYDDTGTYNAVIADSARATLVP